MAGSILDFDEINRPEYEEYFGAMKISSSAKRKRVEAALQLEQAALLGFSTVQYEQQMNRFFNLFSLQRMLRDAYRRIAKQYVDDEYMQNHTDDVALDIALTTSRNVNADNYEDNYYLSDDRAVNIAKTEANVILDHAEYAEAIKNGFTHKMWNTIMDGKERDTHAEANGQVVPIGTPFEIGGVLMMHPGDGSLGAGADEIANCRCSSTYF